MGCKRQVLTKFSLITVCFNSDKFIEETLTSVERQVYKDKEHVIVDGGSTDKTLDIIKQHNFSWRSVISEVDFGIYDAMNKGIRRSSGDIIGFINSDDVYASDDVLDRVASIFLDPNVDGCYGDLCYVRQDNLAEIVRYWKSSSFIKGSFAYGWVPAHPTLFLRKELFDCYGHFDLNYPLAADFDLMFRFIELHQIRVRYISKVLVKMRVGGATNRNISNIFKQNIEIWSSLGRHGYSHSLPRYFFGKLISRFKQFLGRPK